jgi:ABC-2 type transport system ATP-binding protein
LVSGEAAIEVRGLHKRYGDFEAVRGIDITVRRGEVFGLLGPNGAGKTTTVEILEGYRARSGGEVSVLGYDPGRRESALRKRIGIVLQSSGIYSHLTPREALRHWAALYPSPRDVEEVLALVGLREKAEERTRKLSGGQLRRLDFALALVGDPELIFLDEPTTGFDPEARRAAWDTVRSLRALGKTILLTTHYLDEAQALADRVAIVKDGRVLAIGPPEELSAQPPGTQPPGTPPTRAAHYRVAYRDARGEPVEIQTEDPTSVLAQLTSEALARGERLEELSVGRPTLEDVYLELTASSMADTSAGPIDNPSSTTSPAPMIDNPSATTSPAPTIDNPSKAASNV